MAIATFGPVLSSTNAYTNGTQTILRDGRIAFNDLGNVRLIGPTGGPTQTVDVFSSVGLYGNSIAGLVDGGFAVSGSYGGGTIAYAVFNADGSVRKARTDIVDGGFFDGGIQTGTIVKALPNGGFVVTWNSIQDALPQSAANPVGVTTGGNAGIPVFQGGSGPVGTSVDVRGAIYSASGAVVQGNTIITQGTVQLPGYNVNSRFGQQYIYDLDVLPDGDIVPTILGIRWSPPSGGDLNGTFTSGYFYDSFRLLNGSTLANKTGETPYNADAPIGLQQTAGGDNAHQTVVLSNGNLAGIYMQQTGQSGINAYAVKMQVMGTNGVPIGPEIDMALSDSNRLQLRAAPTESGGVLVAYEAYTAAADFNDYAKYEVFVREYAANGAVVQTQRITTNTVFERLYGLNRTADGTYVLSYYTDFAGTMQTQLLATTAPSDLVLSGGSTPGILDGTSNTRNFIYAGTGADTINGGAGSNNLYGGAGDSVFNGGSGINVIYGGSGNETMRGGAQGDTASGGAGNDRLLGFAGPDSLAGNAGTDTLIGDGPLSLTAAAQSIRRLYVATLDRGPDDAGWQGWTTARDGGQSLDSIAQGFVGSSEFQTKYGALTNAAFVTLLYQNVLDRNPDAGGLAAFTQALDSGSLTRTGVVTTFSESAEFKAGTTPELHAGQIFRLYGATLARSPDAAGFEGWTDALGGGRGLVDIAAGFVGSSEFQTRYGALDNTGFVTLLYQNVLGRAPDQAGLDGWRSQLDSAALSRTQVVTGFSESGEYVAGTRSALDGFVRNTMTSWSDTLVGGAGNDSLTGGRGSDRFVFFQSEGGNDTVYGFDGFDTLQLTGFGFASPAAALAAMSQQGANVALAYTGGSITFAETQLSTLQSLPAQGWVLG